MQLDGEAELLQLMRDCVCIVDRVQQRRIGVRAIADDQGNARQGVNRGIGGTCNRRQERRERERRESGQRQTSSGKLAALIDIDIHGQVPAREDSLILASRIGDTTHSRVTNKNQKQP